MTQEELVLTIKDMGRSLGMCDKFYDRFIESLDIDTMIDMYAAGFDFCVEKDFPPLDFVRRNFDIRDLHRHGIYIDEKLDIDGNNGSYFLLGECSGEIRFSGFRMSDVYIRHDSHVRVVASGLSKVFVTLHERGMCETKTIDGGLINVYDRKKEG